MSGDKVTARQVFDMLSRAAEEGRPCPTNQEIVDTLGCKSRTLIIFHMNALADMGHISVERFQCRRRVTIPSTGKSTALPTGIRLAPHHTVRRSAA